MIDKKIFKKAFSAPLEKAGFTKKGQTWYLDGRDTIVVVNLQKSNYSEDYYVNVGIWLKALGDASFPQVEYCQLNYRMENLFPDQLTLIRQGCSLAYSDAELLTGLSDFLAEKFIPFAQSCTDDHHIRELFAQGDLKRGLIFMEARKYLQE